MIKEKIIKLFKKMLAKKGYIVVKDEVVIPEKDMVCLNVGSGRWSLSGWTNLDYPSVVYQSSQTSPFVPYDMRSDVIPYKADEVDLIYCCHVIEHIEDCHVQRMFEEAYRVLKKGGVLRIATPDASFLYDVTKANIDYWTWRTPWFVSRGFSADEVRPVDYLVREVATSNLKKYGWVQKYDDYEEEFRIMKKEDFIDWIAGGVEYEVKYCNEHINYYTFEKVEAMLKKAGFKLVIRSKCHTSVSKYMKSMQYFDITQPQMSLYVEAIKE